MSTAAKPKPSREFDDLMSRDDTIAAAKKVHAAVRRKVTAIMAEEETNRSTRAQRAQRLKAQGFDDIGRILHRAR